MHKIYSLLLVALGLPGLACAQAVSDPSAAKTADYWAAREVRPQFYLGAAAAMPVYWRDARFGDYSSPWAFLTAFAGVRFNAHWLAQVGFNTDRASHSYQLGPGLSGPGPAVGTFTGKNAQTALPVLVRYHLSRKPLPRFALEAFAGVTPQWQRFTTSEVSGQPGQPATETSTQSSTSTLHATVGLSGVFDLGPGTDVLIEAGLNQRVLTSGTSYAPVRTPTLAVGFRCRFVHLPRRGSYLQD